MRATDILEHFLSCADWIEPDRGIDQIIGGDPEREIRTVLVTWISSFDALRTAVERGSDMLITHEPTFYVNMGELNAIDDSPAGRQKMDFIEQNGLVVMRNHDCWDRWPEIGMPWAWARFLELGDRPVAFGNRRAQHRYDIDTVTVDELAQRVARRTALIGQPQVQVTGEGSRPVSKVGIGTGCICHVPEFVEMGCDVSVVCDDGANYCSRVQMAKDLGHPVIRVNHPVSEEPGMVTLTQYLNEHIESVTAEHLPHGCYFRLIGA